ncbi:MAG TPA: adenylate/guanylate cyclase domain-containing protein [Lacipirellulaceae bacterium]|nr:adenylate/guanylate cyclase domain-containing protein [Lacipirellulaceae bacterium]
MWHVTVFSRTQHTQQRSLRSRFALEFDERSGQWSLAEDSAGAPGGVMHVRAEERLVRLECRGVSDHIELDDGAAFWTAKPIELALPARFRLHETWFEIASCFASPEIPLEPLGRPTGRPGLANLRGQQGPEPETIANWFESVGRLHRTVASAPEFFSVAARLTRECTGLDAVIALVRRDGQWIIAGSDLPHPEHGIAFDPEAMARVFDHPDVWRSPPRPPADERDGDPRADVSLVVAPVLNDEGEVQAALYGVRHGRGDNRRQGIRPLEARVVELMANAVGVGMSRQQQELEAASQQLLLEQAFSPTVVAHLRSHPEALAGCTRETTLLFADLRGFTALAERLAPAHTYELLGVVMELLTQAVMDHGGAVIDSYADGLSALWTAPPDVPEHADLACTAAMQMLDAIPAVSEAWRSRLGDALELGVGLHAGEVQVGNAGTRRRMKYGPRGLAVHVASRVQAATRQIDVPLLATDAVRRRLSSRFVTLRACTARLPGLAQAVDLFTVFPATDGERLQDDLSRYAEALAAFEAGDLPRAESLLERLLERGPATPAGFLADHAAALRKSALGRRAGDAVGATAEAVIEILAK